MPYFEMPHRSVAQRPQPPVQRTGAHRAATWSRRPAPVPPGPVPRPSSRPGRRRPWRGRRRPGAAACCADSRCAAWAPALAGRRRTRPTATSRSATQPATSGADLPAPRDVVRHPVLDRDPAAAAGLDLEPALAGVGVDAGTDLPAAPARVGGGGPAREVGGVEVRRLVAGRLRRPSISRTRSPATPVTAAARSATGRTYLRSVRTRSAAAALRSSSPTAGRAASASVPVDAMSAEVMSADVMSVRGERGGGGAFAAGMAGGGDGA